MSRSALSRNEAGELASGEPLLADHDRRLWADRVLHALAERPSAACGAVEEALGACSGDPELLLLAALSALVARRPEPALVFVKRYRKRYVPGKAVHLLSSLAVAQQGHVSRAWAMLQAAELDTFPAASRWFVGGAATSRWLREQLLEVRIGQGRTPMRPGRRATVPRSRGDDTAVPRTRLPRSAAPSPAPAPAPQPPPDLPRLEARFDVRFEIINLPAIAIEGATEAPEWFRLPGELTRLSLLEGFDELLCVPALQGVETHWHQVETVRKVLKQYRGRVLLADEVGLGKTVEAGMVLKEYVLRGMADRILILTPASLVGQWRDEMDAKFGIGFATTHDPLLRTDPTRFWGQKRVIASIATARRREHADLLAGLPCDVVVVDEAHHLKDQSSASYRLVNSLQKRFLLLLSATPVQNSLLGLFNLLTLLQPGIFKTAKEFRAAYMVPGKPREPANRNRLHELMRSVMVRNTRALAALRLPRRQAATLRVTQDEAEAACYRELTALAREAAASGRSRLAIQHLLAAAGSSPAAAVASLSRIIEREALDARWAALLERYRALGAGAKPAALLRLLAQNPAEKKLVFVHHHDSMTHLAALLQRHRIGFVRFADDLSGVDKDAAVEAFRDRVPVMLCSESGGEGRNLQFCNTLINFDIPWNPMAIEQRIGRIDRIGQTREVFVFNLAASGTLEDAMLRILDGKINMFELVVGEVGAILGALEEEREFSTVLLDAWLQAGDAARAAALALLEDQLVAARRDYDGVKQLDEALFGNELDVA